MGFGCCQIKRPDVAIFGFCHPELEVISKAQVEGQTIGYTPVVVCEESMADDLHVVIRPKLDERAVCRQPEQKRCDALAILSGSGAVRACVRTVERVRAASPAEIRLLLTQAAPVVPEFHGVRARHFCERRGELHVVKRLLAAVVEAALLRAERGDAACGRRSAGFDAEAWELSEVSEQRQGGW
jgi:hypothetical protein